MNNFMTILLHTYLSKLKTKSFIITTIITVLIVVGLANLSGIIDFFNKDNTEKIAVIDQSGVLFSPLEEQMKVINKDIQLEAYKGTEKGGEDAVNAGGYKGLLLLSFDNENLPEATYKARSIADSAVPSELQSGLQQLKTQLAASQINLTPDQLGKLYEPVDFNQIALEKNAKTKEELNQARGLVYVLLFVIYFAVIMYANMIAMEVATEKSSRVMEILISSVSPIKQMFAKILGIGLLSLTQMALILLAGYYSIKQNLDSMEGGFFEFFGFGDIPASTIAYALIFFLLGYFLYATLAAFLGSLVSRIEDIQQMITPMTMMVVAGFMIAMFGLNKPEAPFVTITSYIPFFTPMLMFMRVGMLSLPAWEPILGILILLVTIAILAVFGARVYRGGVLMYGKSNSFKDIKKALQLTKNE
ncbi:ABC-2 type transport system permease protein [Cytobacillus oceanisediminis]|jgi:ABC-2 type transport system permease protein|uniref:ABC-2 type transport system permease protein n=1 Tax=Cytobacillus oceanisediminis TaxID=665099 RepID=A0A2V2ZTX7_9BACI|nr:ABC transporter permease [Cytobacillus oceanisediminis]PWW27825.1 ABC-2 type transport system permease protein [Cytobacillus oceanisediminis]